MAHVEWADEVYPTIDKIDQSKPHRYMETYRDPHVPSGYGWQQGELVRDPDEGPEEDGIYVDSEGDIWIRVDGLWAIPNDLSYFNSDAYEAIGTKWEADPVTYAPFKKITIVERGN